MNLKEEPIPEKVEEPTPKVEREVLTEEEIFKRKTLEEINKEAHLKKIHFDFDKYFIFTLKNDIKNLKIKSINNLDKLPMQPKFDNSFISTSIIYKSLYNFDLYNSIYLDFEKISKKYDSIELFRNEDFKLNNVFYGWDCSCILILNPDTIIVEK